MLSILITSSARFFTVISGGRIKDVSVKVGDIVKQGQILASLDADNALGAVTQAKATYASMQANYQKIINGATSASIDVAKAVVATAKTALEEATKQQALLVSNARTQLLSQGLQAIPETQGAIVAPPVISGSYTKNTEGTITLNVYQSGDGGYFTATGLVSGSGKISNVSPQPIGDSGLFVLFSTNSAANQPNWKISIPNQNSASYVSNYNAYQAALQTKESVIANAQAQLTQAQANLTALQVAARPEDVAQAQAQLQSAFGALQIAQGVYNNTIITAPTDGKVTMVAISKGQIATPNTPAIELLGTSVSKDNVLLVPRRAVITKDAHTYVRVKKENSFEERAVVLGVEDQNNVEVVSGLQQGESVAILN
jgi:HlyD family secretion protein